MSDPTGSTTVTVEVPQPAGVPGQPPAAPPAAAPAPPSVGVPIVEHPAAPPALPGPLAHTGASVLLLLIAAVLLLAVGAAAVRTSRRLKEITS